MRNQFKLTEIPVEEWEQHFPSTSKDVGIPQYFCADSDGNIKVWPKPEAGTGFHITCEKRFRG